jgi:hypothetical protein
MILFSQRNGLVPEKILQDKDFDVISRLRLANEIIKLFEICRESYETIKPLESFHQDLVDYGIEHGYWEDCREAERVMFFQITKVKEYDLFNDNYEKNYIRVSAEVCKDFFKRLAWKQTLKILELLIKNMGTDVLNDYFNNIFVKIGWAYKVTCDGQIIPTMDDISFESLEETLSQTGKWEGVKKYAAKAVSLYKEGKYEEACMQSAKALDKLAQVISGKDKIIFSKWIGETKDVLPPEIQKEATAIYAIRNNRIGHPDKGEDKIDEAKHEIDASFAKWYLVSCSALINWMIEKYA